MKEDTILLLCVILGVALVLTAIYGLSYVRALSFQGHKCEVTISVRAVEYTTRFGEHTVVFATNDETYILVGRINLTPGKTYRIVYVNQIWFTPLGFEVRGQMLELEEIETE